MWPSSRLVLRQGLQVLLLSLLLLLLRLLQPLLLLLDLLKNLLELGIIFWHPGQILIGRVPDSCVQTVPDS